MRASWGEQCYFVWHEDWGYSHCKVYQKVQKIFPQQTLLSQQEHISSKLTHNTHSCRCPHMLNLGRSFSKTCHSINVDYRKDDSLYSHKSKQSLFFLLHKKHSSFSPPCNLPIHLLITLFLQNIYPWLSFHHTSLLDHHFHGDGDICCIPWVGASTHWRKTNAGLHCHPEIPFWWKRQIPELDILSTPIYPPGTGTAGSFPPMCRRCRKWAGHFGAGTGCSDGGRTRGSRTGRRWGFRSRTPFSGTSLGQPESRAHLNIKH